MYGVGRLDDVAFVFDVHGLAFLWVIVHEPATNYQLCTIRSNKCLTEYTT